MNSSQSSALIYQTSKVISLDVYRANKAKIEEKKRQEAIENRRLNDILLKQTEKKKRDARILKFMVNFGHVILLIMISLVSVQMFPYKNQHLKQCWFLY
ncbi:hypothetical protein bcgnr5372_46420 [Bacillus luti]|nr:hypothetical protein [Bacillus cereus]HDR8329614.1 hypothetical protein [Bacillus cereus]HDR8336304.1 hypothetical protein [Bacillus cereus]